MCIDYIKKITVGICLLSSVSYADCVICTDLKSLIEKQQLIINYKYSRYNEEFLKSLIEMYAKHLEECHGEKM